VPLHHPALPIPQPSPSPPPTLPDLLPTPDQPHPPPPVRLPALRTARAAPARHVALPGAGRLALAGAARPVAARGARLLPLGRVAQSERAGPHWSHLAPRGLRAILPGVKRTIPPHSTGSAYPVVCFACSHWRVRMHRQAFLQWTRQRMLKKRTIGSSPHISPPSSAQPCCRTRPQLSPQCLPQRPPPPPTPALPPPTPTPPPTPPPTRLAPLPRTPLPRAPLPRTARRAAARRWVGQPRRLRGQRRL
jgi:hypothetical protein